MKYATLLLLAGTRGRLPGRSGRYKLGSYLWLLPLLAILVSPKVVRAQSGPTASPDAQTLQALMRRIDQLEARVRQLEAAQHLSSPVSATTAVARQQPASAPAGPLRQQSSPATSADEPPQTAAPQEHEAEPTEHAESERMDLSKTLLRIRGFGDVTLHGDNYHPSVPPPIGAPVPASTTAFTLGQLNLFVTSDISDKFKFLSEIVFEAGPDNIYGARRGEANTFGVDVERYLLTYSANDYFSLSAGRYHTAIGYYNTAYHHSTWLQTTTGRPLLFQFEDRGGILPIHNVGVEAHGRIPSGSLGLHYVVEVGNGRESRNPIEDEPVQNIITDKTHKAYNLALFARPTKVPGLQAGFSFYRDLQVPKARLPVGETILAAQEPIFPDIELRAGPQVGLRYDASESVALKLQYDYTALRDQHATQGLEAQVGFTF